MCESGEYKNIIVLLTPQMSTEPKVTAEAVIKLAKEYKNVNIFCSFIGGERVREAVNMLKTANVLTYDYPTDCIRLLGLMKAQMAFRGMEDVKV